MSDFDAKVQEVIAGINDAVEAEVRRLLPDWPVGMGEPCLIFGPGHQFMGLGPKVEVGRPAAVVLPARRIVLKVTT